MAIRLPPLVLVWLFALLAGALLLGGMIKRRGIPEPTGAFVEWGARGITRDGELLVDSAAIESIRCEPSAAGVMIRVGERSGAAREFRCPDLSSAHAHVRRLGRDPDCVTLGFETLPHLFALPAARMSRLLVGLALTATLTGALLVAGLLPIAGGLLALAVALLGHELRTGALDLGYDGVVVRWSGAPRFVPFAEVLRAHYEAREPFGRRTTSVVLELRSGELLRLPFGGDDAATVRSAMDGALARVHAERTRPPEALARGARSHEAWIRSLRALGHGADADPRTPGHGSDAFLRIAADATQSRIVRASAAVAAGADADQTTRHRLVELAGAAGDPTLREALVRATERDDQVLAGSLAALEATASLDPESGAGRAPD